MFRLLACACALAPSVAAQITDAQPDWTEGTEAVSRARMEAGVLFETLNGSDGRALDIVLPRLLARIGVVSGLELRLGLSDYRFADVSLPGPSGLTDPAIGAKLALGSTGPWSAATVVEVSLPLGDDEFSVPARPLALLIVQREQGALTLTGQAEALWDRATDRVERGGALVLGVAVADGVTVLAEGALGSTAQGTSSIVQTGATWQFSPVVELEGFAGLGLTEAAPERFVGLGVNVDL